MDFEKILRTVPTTQKIFRSSKRVSAFKVIDSITALSKKGFTADEIKAGIMNLLNEFKIIKVEECKDNPDIVDIVPGQVLSISDTYIWSEEKTDYRNLFYGMVIIVLFLFLIMFQVWPVWIKRSVSYVRYPIIGFILFMIVLGIIRLIVYCITYLMLPNGMWIFPNLFEECGFFESFVPLYSWDNSKENKMK